MGQVQDSTEITEEEKRKRRFSLIPTNSDPGRFERLRKEWLYGKGAHSVVGALSDIWNALRKTNKRIDDLEDRLKELDGISMPRHIYRAPNVTEYYIDRFLPDDEPE